MGRVEEVLLADGVKPESISPYVRAYRWAKSGKPSAGLSESTIRQYESDSQRVYRLLGGQTPSREASLKKCHPFDFPRKQLPFEQRHANSICSNVGHSVSFSTNLVALRSQRVAQGRYRSKVVAVSIFDQVTES